MFFKAITAQITSSVLPQRAQKTVYALYTFCYAQAHPIITIFLIILSISFHQQCLSMENSTKIPTLQNLAFIRATPQIEKKINSIAINKDSIPEKLTVANHLIEKLNLSPRFLETNTDIAELTNQATDYYYSEMQYSTTLPEQQFLNEFPRLKTILENKIAGHYLLAAHSFLPPLQILEASPYALCLLNDSIILAPITKIVFALSPFIQQTFLTNVEEGFSHYIVKQSQNQLSYLKNELPTTNTQASDCMNVTTHHYVNYKKKNENALRLSLPIQEIINNTTVTYSHNKEKMVFINNLNVEMQDIVNNTRLCIANPSPIKKICFTADDTALIWVDHDSLYVYDLTIHNHKSYPLKNIIALHPIQNREFIVLIKPDEESTIHTIQLRPSHDLAIIHFTHEKKYVLKVADKTITDACFSPNGKQIAVGFSSGRIICFDPEKIPITQDVCAKKNVAITKIMFSPDNSVMTAISDYKKVYMWHLTSSYRINRFCLEAAQKITGSYQKSMPAERTLSYFLPLTLLQLPINGDHPAIQQLCTNNSSEVWQKTTNVFELIFTEKLHNCITRKQLNDLNNDIQKKSLAPGKKQLYAQLIATKMNTIDAHDLNDVMQKVSPPQKKQMDTEKVIPKTPHENMQLPIKKESLSWKTRLYATIKSNALPISAWITGIGIICILEYLEMIESQYSLKNIMLALWVQEKKV